MAVDRRLPVRLDLLCRDPAADQEGRLRPLGLGLGRDCRDDNLDGREHGRLRDASEAQLAATRRGPAGHRGSAVPGLLTKAEQALQRAAEIEAASRERERLARGIHDSVLQVLAMVQRRGAEAGGEAAEIGRLAGEQEAALRSLVSDDGLAPAPAGELDLSAFLATQTSAVVSVIPPADPVLLAEHAVTETAATVRQAIDNVHRHCGSDARAWVLIDDEGAAVSVTVRDDGPGIPPGRLAEAAAEGRLGVSQAIKGRIRDLGGTAEISSTPGAGTEIRLRIPRA